MKALRLLPTLVSNNAFLVFWLLCSAGLEVHAKNTAGNASEQTNDNVEMNEVTIHGTATGRTKIVFDDLDSVTHLDLEELNRSQPSDVFEALESVASLSIEGGIRTRGKSFSIRGFSDNEDVLLVVDGVPQNFEKYRAGSSVEIETELLKEIAVFRGGSAVNQGAGYIGGAIQIETKDASDFLDTKSNFGIGLKTGWQTNNDGQRYLLTLFSRPSTNSDLILSTAFRDSNDLHLPNSDSVNDSSENKFSALAKYEYYHNLFDVGVSYRESDSKAREPFDVQNGSSALFGTVRRESSEQATTLRVSVHPDTRWIDTDVNIGQIKKQQLDIGSNLSGGCPEDNEGNLNYSDALCGFDPYEFDIVSANISNSFTAALGQSEHEINVGLQYVEEQRIARRAFLDRNNTPANRADDVLGPLIDNANQPPGTKTSEGFFLDYSIKWQAWRISFGSRYDDISIAPDNPETVRLLRLRGSGDAINFRKVTPSTELVWDTGLLSLFHRYKENFRPPLADELYSRELDGVEAFFNLCDDFSVFAGSPNSEPALSEFGGDVTAFLAARDAWLVSVEEFNNSMAASNKAYLRENAFCGNLYKAEESKTHESGFTIDFNQFLNLNLYKAMFKTTYFDIQTEHLVESIEEVNGKILQPGEERRYGFEVELMLDDEWWFTNINYFDLKGYETGLLADGTTLARFPLNNPPAATFNVIAGLRLFDTRLQFGVKSQIKSSRLVNNDALTGRARDRDDLRRVDGYHTETAFLQWYPTDSLRMHMSVNNVFNETYQLRGFQGAEGEIAPGRDYRLSLEIQI